MGIDHGLQGKSGNTEKGRRKRIQKQRRAKMMMSLAAAESTTTPQPTKKGSKGGKTEVLFDEGSRVAWLTGFGKRKTERRRLGLAMQIMKDKKQHREMVKDKRSAVREATLGIIDKNKSKSLSEDDDDVDDDGGGYVDASGEAIVYTDDKTVEMFGGSVSVVVGTGVAEEMDRDRFYSGSHSDDEDDDKDNQGSEDGDGDDGDNRSVTSYSSNRGGYGNNNKSRNQKPPLTKLQRALKEVGKRNLMTKKKKPSSASSLSASSSNSRGGGGLKGEAVKRQAKNKLLHKAMGAGIIKGKYKMSNRKK